MSENMTYVPSRLTSAKTNKVVAGANEILDDDINLKQDVINTLSKKVIDLNSVPTSSTLTYTVNSVTCDFKVGDEVRVADQNSDTGYTFYKLYALTTESGVTTATWDKLGAGGGSSVFPEFITIQLIQSGGSDSDLIGTTVVVTNDDTSATILSTTWQGSDIPVQVDAGVNYTVTVGDVSSLVIKQHTQSYTAESGLSRIIEFSYFGNVVDMGLPSGILWARTNIDASQASGFAISEFQYNCSFFSFGNIAGHNPISESAFSYDWGTTNSGSYASTPGSQLTGNVPTNATYDIARSVCGDPWRLPTGEEFEELINGCDFVQADGTTVITGTSKLVTVNNIIGVYLKSKTNGNLLFFPCSGAGRNTSWYDKGTDGYYRSSSIASDDNNNCLIFNFYANKVSSKVSFARFHGEVVRPVM